MKTAALSFVLATMALNGLLRADTVDVPIGFVPPVWVTATLRKTLSPQGRFVLLTPNGTVRITDTQAKIEDAQDALEKLQKAPALVSLNLTFTVISKKTVEKQVTQGGPEGRNSFPYPTSYSAPKIAQRSGGGFVV